MAECKRFHLGDIMTMNGSKTYIGLAAIAVGMVMKFYGHDIETGMQIIDAGSVLTGVGLAHKGAKILTVLNQLTSVLQQVETKADESTGS